MTDHFAVVDESMSPQPWMQLRRVGGDEIQSVSQSYSTAGGGNKNDLVHRVTVQWTNDSPVLQHCYGMVTRGGAQVTLQGRSRGYLQTAHAVKIESSASPVPEFELVEASRFGCGVDAGAGGLLAIGQGFAINEVRQNSTTIPLMPGYTGWYRVEPGETIFAQVQVAFVSEYWEYTLIDGGDSGTESFFVSGDTRLDLFAVPAIVDPGLRPVPTIVGTPTHDTSITVDTTAEVSEGTTTGDIVLAVLCNQWGFGEEQTPVEGGWTRIHTRNDGVFGVADVHMKIYWRVVSGGDPTEYSFNNAFLAEQTLYLITLRDASPYLDDGWAVASSLRRSWWERHQGHIAPSIDREGQLLICVSFMAHTGLQSPLTQDPPDGMTEIGEHAASGSTISIAKLDSPPKPTLLRAFDASAHPIWSGHSITASILVPGEIPI